MAGDQAVVPAHDSAAGARITATAAALASLVLWPVGSHPLKLTLCGLVALCTVSLLGLATRRDGEGRALAWLSVPAALLYWGGMLYVALWSPEGDIGGVFPFMLGLVGMFLVFVVSAATWVSLVSRHA